ncbi:hypothetical protein BDV28DRAFT_150281 [Aspergillus coremiiformis]|uniref:Carrier domain-containing protein n=1 Tax=Aspergillus coremiiformis TaxID=138285 RepID=A0A5N6Z2D4_9EURO|nr:hypothetical protein BDV28DRAFT_150281 [Aspergillus coremiiformis]
MDLSGHGQCLDIGVGRLLVLFVPGNDQGALGSSGGTGDGVASRIDKSRRGSFALLHQWLTDHLPRFMVPSVYIPLTYMPILPTGKVDRRALRNLPSEMAFSDFRSYVPLVSRNRDEMTDVERVLHRLVVDQLKIPPDSAGLGESFFKLGGNSIMAIETVNRLRELGWTLTVGDFFSRQTIRALAQVAVQAEPVRPIPVLSMVEDRCVYLQVAAEQCGMSPECIQDIYPCTALQEGLMLLSSERGFDFTATFAFQLPSEVNRDQFQRTWDHIVWERPILRTRIVRMDDGQTCQVVGTDIPHWNNGISLEKVSTRVNGYTLSVGQPLIRYGIAHQGPRRRGPVFVIRMHHAVFDGWSYRNLLDDIEQAYDGHPLPPRASINRLLHHTRRLDPNAASKFWNHAFEGFRGPVFPAPPPCWVRPQSIAVKRCQIPLFTTSQADYTMASVIQLAWAIIVTSRTGSDDVVFGLTVSGRNAAVPGIECLMGPTITTFPIRLNLDMNSTIEDTLRETQTWVARTIPFERTGLIGIGRSSAEATVACQFQTLLVIQPYSLHRESYLLTDLPQNRDQQQKFLSHPPTIVVELQEEGIHVEAMFDETVLRPPSVGHMLEQLQDVIRQILDRPSAPLRTIQCVMDSDLEQIGMWNQEKGFNAGMVHDVIQDWLVSQPDSLAIAAWDGLFTYRQLLEHAQQWAGHLQAHGATRGDIVGIYMKRSKWQIVAMLGVLLAGSPFVMLAPEFPPKRLREMCQTANTKIIITSPATSSDAHISAVERTITLPPANRPGYSWMPPCIDRNSPMYVAFTSGPTGSPKGIIVEHAMCHITAQAYQETIGLNTGSRVLYTSSAAFDLHIVQTMWTLLAGGCICIP